MQVQHVLSEYINQAMSQAEYDKLEDNSFSGRIPTCNGVIALASTLRECEDALRSTLEDWLLLGLKLRHRLPEINGINRWNPCRRSVFVRRLRELGLSGPYSGNWMVDNTMKKWLPMIACVGTLAVQSAHAQSTKMQLDNKNFKSQSLSFTVNAEHGIHGEHFGISVGPRAGKTLPSIHSARLNIFRGSEPIADCLVQQKERADGKGVVYGFFVSSKFLADSTFILAVKSRQEGPNQPMKVYVFNLKDFANSK